MKGAPMKYSRQREEVKDQLSTHHDHPTADVIYAELREKDSSISLATVYRNLNLLSSIGEIRKLSFTSGADHFDPEVETHYHFVCEKCGKVTDIPMDAMKQLNRKAQEHVPGVVMGHDLVFYGVCAECSQNSGKNKPL